MPLRPGDRVAIVAPSHPVVAAQLEAGLAAVRRFGFEPVVLPHVHDVHGHHAGSDEARLDDLQAALDDPSLRAVWVARGGSGLTRIIDRVDWTAAARARKLIVGMSDATALVHAAWVRARLVTVHGQFAGRAHELERYPDAARHLVDMMTGRFGTGPLPRLAGDQAPTTAVDGVADGRLVGGNLTLLAASIGTSWQLDLASAVLFVEEVNEPPYALDRLLTHLLTAGVLQDVAGVVVGRLRGCDPPLRAPAGGGAPVPVPSAMAEEVFVERLGGLGVPMLTDLPIGHVDRHLAVPHGVLVRLDASAGSLTIREPVTA